MSEIEYNILRSIDTLHRACREVGGNPPNLEMTLKDFILEYGRNGVGFIVLEDV